MHFATSVIVAYIAAFGTAAPAISAENGGRVASPNANDKRKQPTENFVNFYYKKTRIPDGVTKRDNLLSLPPNPLGEQLHKAKEGAVFFDSYNYYKKLYDPAGDINDIVLPKAGAPDTGKIEGGIGKRDNLAPLPPNPLDELHKADEDAGFFDTYNYYKASYDLNDEISKIDLPKEITLDTGKIASGIGKRDNSAYLPPIEVKKLGKAAENAAPADIYYASYHPEHEITDILLPKEGTLDTEKITGEIGKRDNLVDEDAAFFDTYNYYKQTYDPADEISELQLPKEGALDAGKFASNAGEHLRRYDHVYAHN